MEKFCRRSTVEILRMQKLLQMLNQINEAHNSDFRLDSHATPVPPAVRGFGNAGLTGAAQVVEAGLVGEICQI